MTRAETPLARSSTLVAALVALASAAGCGSSPAKPTPEVTVASVAVTGVLPALGKTSQFTATATMSDESTLPVTSGAVWTSSNVAVATVTSTGLVTSVATGETDIVAEYKTVRGGLHLSVVKPVPPVPAGIRTDVILAAHQFVFGSPTPTQDNKATYCCWPLPVLNAGSFMFDLAKFPLDMLPSGGASNVASASEMLFAGINFSPAASTVKFEWHRAVGADTVIYTSTLGSGTFVWAYTFIGHFDWEINAPGPYYVVITAGSGTAVVDFAIVDSSHASSVRGRPVARGLTAGAGSGGLEMLPGGVTRIR